MSSGDPGLIAALAAVTFVLGLVIGFVGAGGAGAVMALLTSAFGLPIHAAIGTALGIMFLTTVSGAISHFREGNVAPRIGLATGLAGALGAVAGAGLSQGMPERPLQVASGLGLWALAGLLYARTRLAANPRRRDVWAGEPARPAREWGTAVGLGVSGGAAAAFLGVGMAPFLQLGYLSWLGLPLRQTVGTTMFTLVFISATGSLALWRAGDVSAPHLIVGTIGLASGAFIGARFTRRAPKDLLRWAVLLVPVLAGALLLFT
ncbi:MAG: sulfite exporter TauE/SafE family protein [Chloroflexota bacterium]